MSGEVPLERQMGSEWRRTRVAGAGKLKMDLQMGTGNKCKNRDTEKMIWMGVGWWKQKEMDVRETEGPRIKLRDL